MKNTLIKLELEAALTHVITTGFVVQLLYSDYYPTHGRNRWFGYL